MENPVLVTLRHCSAEVPQRLFITMYRPPIVVPQRETLESAVVFYVDPDMAKDANTKDIPAVTLSYTYFPSKNGAPVTTAAAAAGKLN